MENNGDANSKTQMRPLPWNKGKLTGPKPPLRPSQVWAIGTRLQMADRIRDLALFNLAIDSKLRGCDAVAVRAGDVAPSGYALDRATIRQKKTGPPVRFELTDQTRAAIRRAGSRRGNMRGWSMIGERALASTASIRHAFATPDEGGPGVQLLLGHTKIESTVRHLGIEIGEASKLP